MREPTDDGERQTIDDVQNHGWHVVKVMGDSEGPSFAYTVGLTHSFGHPELIVVGLRLDVAHSLLNHVGEMIRRGARFADGLESDEIFVGRTAAFRDMPAEQFENYMTWTLWFYDGWAFSALQLVWPDDHGRWPWDPSVEPSVREDQPVIADQGDPPWVHR